MNKTFLGLLNSIWQLKIALYSISIDTKNTITADLNLAVSRRMGELGQSSHGHGGRHGIGRAKTKQALANSGVIGFNLTINISLNFNICYLNASISTMPIFKNTNFVDFQIWSSLINQLENCQIAPDSVRLNYNVANFLKPLPTKEDIVAFIFFKCYTCLSRFVSFSRKWRKNRIGSSTIQSQMTLYATSATGTKGKKYVRLRDMISEFRKQEQKEIIFCIDYLNISCLRTIFWLA